jgi:hypothetical protein
MLCGLKQWTEWNDGMFVNVKEVRPVKEALVMFTEVQ